MAGQVTELVADSWIEKPCGRSSRSTARSTPPGLPSRAAGAGTCAAAGSAARLAPIRRNARTRAALGMGRSPSGVRLEAPSPCPLPLEGGEGGWELGNQTVTGL